MSEFELEEKDTRKRARLSAVPTGYRRLPRPSTSSAVLDRGALLARVGEDAGLLRELVGIYLEEHAVWVEEIHASIRRNDARMLKLKAHLLSGTSASLGAKRVSEAARELELLGQKGTLSGAVESFELLLAAIDELKPHLIELTHVPAV
jgi:HPt (histidine-containing phosphotransfer) domain-containing protein